MKTMQENVVARIVKTWLKTGEDSRVAQKERLRMKGRQTER